MTYETVDACEVCGSAERWLAVERDRYGADYHLWCCEGCGLMYASPRLDEDSAREFYAGGEYRRIYNADLSDDAHALACRIGNPRTNAMIDNIADFLRHFGLAPKRVLEYGCGRGDWLVELRDAFGCEVFGVDDDPAMEEVARGRGIRNEVPNDNRTDIVIYNHVLEHLRRPGAHLAANKAAVLAPGGAIFIAVPGLYTWKRPELWQAAHNYQFTERSLKALLSYVGGFSKLYCDEMVTSLWLNGYVEPESETIGRFLGRKA